MKVELDLDQRGFGSRVLLDGSDVAHGLNGLSLVAKVGEVPRLLLHVLPEGVRVTGDMEVLRALPEELPMRKPIDPPDNHHWVETTRTGDNQRHFTCAVCSLWREEPFECKPPEDVDQ